MAIRSIGRRCLRVLWREFSCAAGAGRCHHCPRRMASTLGRKERRAERARDLIQRDFTPGPTTNRRYVGNVTHIATWQGFAYLATVIDLATRRVVEWAGADHMRTSLVEDALQMAFVQRRPPRGVIFHSTGVCNLGSRSRCNTALSGRA
jgi:putative transposase